MAAPCSRMIETARAFLALLQDGSADDKHLTALARALDGLAFCYHEVGEGAPSDGDIDPPRQEYQQLRAVAARRFPELGLYNVVAPAHDYPGQAEPTVADALDDLADIADELGEVVWRWENTGPADARWRFRLGYEVHWGRHLHDLRGYVHALLFEDAVSPVGERPEK